MIFSRGSRPAVLRPTLLMLVTAAAVTLASGTYAASRRSHTIAKRSATDGGTYKGVIVVDAATGSTLFEDRADEMSPPASMTKLMTFAVLSDKLASGAISLDTPVPIDASDAGMGGTQVFLDPRETFSVEELVYAMMIQSANDAAHALARISAGSVEAFVGEMNAKARELGMQHTTFRSPHGLPPSDGKIADGDLTTPRDYALLCRYLLLHTDVLKYTSVKVRTFGPKRPTPMIMKNHNNLLGQLAGVDGLKTGYTKGAGYCLSATAERNGRRVILVIMGAFGPNHTVDFGRSRDRKAIELIERGFTAMPATSNFDAERSKYVKPAVISLDSPAATSSTTAAPLSAPPPATAPPAASDDTPSVKFQLPAAPRH